jgi:membrane-bound lytic murein transglycosylase D
MHSKTTKGGLIFILFLFLAAQASFAGFSDTLKNLAVNKNNTGTTAIREANIIYPEILQGQEQYFAAYVEKFSINRRAYLMRTYTRGKRFFPKANTILKKYNVPTEFVVLLALESAFNANAVSSAGAVGYWQIMDDVAKEYGLKIEEGQKKLAPNNNQKLTTSTKGKALLKKPLVTDERKNFTKSTHTAARYLKDRMRNLKNDWLLVAASYNWGVGNVWKAMQRTGKAAPTFWDIKNYLPEETKAYVMNFISLNVIFKNYDHFSKGSLCFKDMASVTELGVDKEVALIEE